MQKPADPGVLKFRDVLDIDEARIKEKPQEKQQPNAFPTFDDLVSEPDANDNSKTKKANINQRAQEKPTTSTIVRPPGRLDVPPPALLVPGLQKGQLISQIQSIRNEYKRETQKLRSELATLQKTVALYKDKVDNLSNRLDNSKNNKAKYNQGPAMNVINQLQKTVNMLQKKVEEQEQESQITDLEIMNVPETPDEILVNVVQAVAKNMGNKLELRDIVFAERKGTLNKMHKSPNTEQIGRPIVVRLANSYIRDQMVRSARLRQGSNTTIFIKERLTQTVKDLFYQTHQAANTHDWKFVWTKHGKIFTKKSENEPTYVINSDADIERIFGELSATTDGEIKFEFL